jgi:hypothetical protein
MFIAREQLYANRITEIVAAVKPDMVQRFLDSSHTDGQRISSQSRYDLQRFGTMKAVRIADMTGEGRSDTVITCEGAQGDKSGVYLVVGTGVCDGRPRYIDVGGPEGVKYDRIELIDLDADGDLDILTCEEADNLGVIWYENPLR